MAGLSPTWAASAVRLARPPRRDAGREYLSALLLALPLVAPATALAQNYPSKPLRWVVPYAAGGGSDFLARTIGTALSVRIGQPVLIENKPGGNTAIAAADVARSPADGYTVLSADNGTLVFNPALYKSLTYNPTRDFAPVTLMGRFPMILVVNPEFGVASAKEFIAKAKAKPGSLNYASAGAGSPTIWRWSCSDQGVVRRTPAAANWRGRRRLVMKQQVAAIQERRLGSDGGGGGDGNRADFTGREQRGRRWQRPPAGIWWRWHSGGDAEDEDGGGPDWKMGTPSATRPRSTPSCCLKRPAGTSSSDSTITLD